MDDKEAKEIVNKIFAQIKNAETIQELLLIEQDEILKKTKIDIENYPKINFSISSLEIYKLIKDNWLTPTLSLESDVNSQLTDPLIKLLYALVWKNGDLIKLKHIAKGILEANQNDENQNDALVFYQFGKYLTKTKGQPIIDQHVIRAFSVYKESEPNKIRSWRELKTLNKKHKDNISHYIKWLTSKELKEKLLEEEEYSYYIDRILFATGKAIKIYK